MDQIFQWPFRPFFYLGLALAFAVLAVAALATLQGLARRAAVQAAIRRQLNPLIYVDMHNVTLPTADGGSTQIDHLIFSPYGLFVLETKNFQGWIFGTEKQREWTQQIFRKRSRFQNPLRQNYKHVKTLQSLLDIAPEHLHSVIAFVGDCEFKTEMPAMSRAALALSAISRALPSPCGAPSKCRRCWTSSTSCGCSPVVPPTGGMWRMSANCRRPARHANPGWSRRQKPRPNWSSRPRPRRWIFCWSLSFGAAFGRSRRQGYSPPSQPLRLLPSGATAAEAAEPVCPQCEWPLRKLLMQRGPLAGQAIWRCTNAAACSFVRAHV
jgi:hypothetical protein